MIRIAFGLLIPLSLICMRARVQAQTILLSDSFERTAGSTGDPGAIPPDVGFSDWGAFDNSLGGTIAPIAYRKTNATNANQQTVNEGFGELRFGRTILDYNFATDPNVQAAGGFSVEYKINVSDAGGGGLSGRDWGGVALVDTNSVLRTGGPGAISNFANDNIRAATLPRNSGSMLIRLNNSTDVDLPSTGGGNTPNADDASEYRRVVGNPLNAGFNEPIFDAAAHSAYTATMGGDAAYAGGFENPAVYTVRMEITSPNFLNNNGPALIRTFVNGLEVDLNDGLAGVQGNSFRLGNDPSLSGTDTDVNTLPYQGGLYLAFIGNSATHLIDDLVVSVASIAPPMNDADFNSDGIVDGNDFLIWQRGFGLTGQTGKANGNANSDMVVDGADLAVWKSRFGGPPSLAAVHAVPEGTTLVMAAMAMGLCGARRPLPSRLVKIRPPLIC